MPKQIDDWDTGCDLFDGPGGAHPAMRGKSPCVYHLGRAAYVRRIPQAMGLGTRDIERLLAEIANPNETRGRKFLPPKTPEQKREARIRRGEYERQRDRRKRNERRCSV